MSEANEAAGIACGSSPLLSGSFDLGTDHACLTGDCQHDTNKECWESLRQYIRDLCDEGNRVVSIVGCVVRNCQHIDDTEPRDEPGPMCGPTWAKVSYVCGLGATSAIKLCREFGVEPDRDCARDVA